MRRIIKSKQGISLIVLVITIIIMIVLATAVILSLSSSDIVNKANAAKSSSDYANAKNLASTAYAEWMLAAQGTRGTLQSYVNTKLREANLDSKYQSDLDGQVVVVPSGFIMSTYAGENRVKEGLVIYETNLLTGVTQGTAQTTRNQFVWVPVEDGWEKGHEWGKGYITLSSITEGKTPPLEHLNSINTYGGFYIARYEAGKPNETPAIDGTDKPVSIKGATVWNDIPWDAEWTNVKTTYGDPTNPGCALVASKAYEGSSSVISSLMYGAEWDAALSFISKTNSGYATNSIGMGWYDQDEPTTTGSNIDYAVNNIYDMAGNILEWTYESCKGFDNSFLRVARGGACLSSASDYPASKRVHGSPKDRSKSTGFRVVLCIK